jgi:hypothetical protein
MDPKLLQQIEDYLKASGLKADELRKRMDDVKASTTEFNRELSNAQRHFNELNSDFNDLAQQFKNVLDDLRGWNSTSGLINKSFKILGGLADKLKYDAQDISDLNLKDLKSIEKKAKIELESLRTRKKELEQLGYAQHSEEELRAISQLTGSERNKQLAKEAAQYIELKNLIETNGQLTNDENNYIKTLLALLDERTKKEEKIQSAIGLTGNALKALNKIPGLSGALDTEQALEDMREFAKGLQADGEDINSFDNKLKIAGKGLSTAFGGLKKSLTDPVAILSFFVGKALEANTQVVALGKSLGYAGGKADSYRENLAQIARSSTNIFATTANLSEAFGELAKATGFAYEFTEDQLVTQVKLTKQVGLTADEAAQVQRFAVLNGKTSEETYRSFLKGITASRNQLKVGIDFKATLAEASKVSGQLAAQLGNNPELIGRAVVSAKALGMTLEQVAKAGNTLLDFGTSISSELEAELLTGKQLNLERARAAALAGDQITLAEELAKNMGTAAEFTKLNKLQQDSLAKSIGMSSDELAETLRKREEALASGKSLAQVTEEEAAKALERTTIQDKFNQAILKLQGFIGDLIAGPLGSLIDMLTDALSLVNLIALPFSLIYDFTSMIGSGIGGWLDGLGIAGKLIKGIASAAIIFAAYSAFGSLGPIFGSIAAAAITAAGFGLLNSRKGDDVMSEGGYGKRTLLSPEGAIKLNDKDTVIAGTNLGGGAGGGSMPQIDLTPMIMAINEVRAAVDRLYSKDQSINMDGKKVGTTLVQGSYKVA